jgi:hypothetical protein
MAFGPPDAVAVIAIVFGLTKVAGPVIGALAERVRGGGHRPEGADDVLAAEVDQLRGRLAEVEERLDFAERLLAQAREADQLPGGAQQ